MFLSAFHPAWGAYGLGADFLINSKLLNETSLQCLVIWSLKLTNLLAEEKQKGGLLHGPDRSGCTLFCGRGIHPGVPFYVVAGSIPCHGHTVPYAVPYVRLIATASQCYT